MHQALTIAGSDSGGGAGIQADLKTFAALSVYGMSVITALTAQNTQGVEAVESSTPSFVVAQLSAVMKDMKVSAAKTGMLFSEEIILALADYLRKNKKFWLVVDPVMVATSGARLLNGGAEKSLRERILPLADVLTPNQDEAEVLVGYQLRNVGDVQRAGRDLLRMGCKAAVITGVKMKHHFGDFYFQGTHQQIFESKYVETPHTHGTGCSFSAALTAWLARGRPLPEAIKLAQLFVNRGLYYAFTVGEGSGPINHMASFYPGELTDSDLCELRSELFKAEKSRFAVLKKPIINVILGGQQRKADFDYYRFTADLIEAGAELIQYRQKEGDSRILLTEAQEIKKACHDYGALMVVNDRVDIALACGADGVHLGQDDLAVKMARAILGPDKIIGVSAGDVREAARAQAEGADYIGVGPSYSTTSKEVTQAPGGAEQIMRIWSRVDIPILAIGGITAENAPPLIEAGASGIAVISYVLQDAEPAVAVRRLKAAVERVGGRI